MRWTASNEWIGKAVNTSSKVLVWERLLTHSFQHTVYIIQILYECRIRLVLQWPHTGPRMQTQWVTEVPDQDRNLPQVPHPVPRGMWTSVITHTHEYRVCVCVFEGDEVRGVQSYPQHVPRVFSESVWLVDYVVCMSLDRSSFTLNALVFLISLKTLTNARFRECFQLHFKMKNNLQVCCVYLLGCTVWS